MSEIKAQWAIELNCVCPGCEKYVDLIEEDDFWVERGIKVGENGTRRTSDMLVVCPSCHHEFEVDCEL